MCEDRRTSRRSRLLARAAALILAAGGLLVIPASPANAHCADHDEHPDRYDRGGIFWAGGNGTPVRHYPHVDCDVFMIAFAGDGINVHCAREVEPPGTNDWVWADRSEFGEGWAREGQLNVPNSLLVPGCANGSNLVFIQQNP